MPVAPAFALRTAQFLYGGLRAAGERSECAPWGPGQAGFPYRVLRLTSDSNSLFTALVSCRRDRLHRSTGLYTMRRHPQALQFQVMSL